MASAPKLSLNVISWLDCIWTTDLPSASKLVAAYLRSYMNSKHDMAWPSLQRIEKETGLGHSTVCKHLEILEQLGWIKRNRGHGGSVNKSTEYIACFPRSIEEAIASIPSPPGGLPQSTKRSTVVHQTDTNTQENKQVNNQEGIRAGKFIIKTDWKPHADTLSMVCMRKGIPPEQITDSLITDFVLYWSASDAAFPEQVWASKLCDQARRNQTRPILPPKLVRPDPDKPSAFAISMAAELERDREQQRNR